MVNILVHASHLPPQKAIRIYSPNIIPQQNAYEPLCVQGLQSGFFTVFKLVEVNGVVFDAAILASNIPNDNFKVYA